MTTAAFTPSDGQSVDFDVAQHILHMMIAVRSAKIAREEKNVPPNHQQIQSWRQERDQLADEEAALLPTDSEAINRIVNEYAPSVRRDLAVL